MRADWIWMQSATGGAGALTCAALPGWPGFADVITTPHLVDYTILEFSDAALSALTRAETGVGSFNPTSGLLTRSMVQRTWDGTVYLPREGVATQPSALGFGSDATKVRISCAPTINLLPALPVIGTYAGFEGLGTFPLNLNVSGVSPYQPGSGQVRYTPIYLAQPGPVSMASIRVGDNGDVVTSPTSAGALVGIYEIAADGTPGKKLVDFGFVGPHLPGGSNPFAGSATLSSTPLATPAYLEPGWYWQAVLFYYDGTGLIRMRCANSIWAASPAGSYFSVGATIASGLRSQATGLTSLSDPAPAIQLDNNAICALVAYK